ncbi:hypothetical protein GQ651_12815 [Alphaproteobacteria bacterium GH1-50]|uniref:Dolichyl-phosphate-mannose-protein mannosyltransferase n=2 Tax=Kangsaoukella pontilimi TaxID=2691042 RepID=A0A7C9ME67_9RHOB|nr:hypothetical protein [Kangsaoukella pontilimi]
MNSGLWPHVDFVTPLGILGFVPFTHFMGLGYSVGDAILYGQVAFAVCLLPLTLYVGLTRLPALAAYVFGLLMVLFAMALTYGGTGPGISMSMHYNRWAWVIASLAVLLALLPRQGRPAQLFDGVLLALLFSLLILLKVTFFVALVPGVLVALLLQERRREIVAALVAGVVFGAVLLVALGPDYWFGYAADLLNVSGSEVRPHTGVPFADIVGAPGNLAITAVGFMAFLFLHRAGHRPQAVGLLLLLPGFMFITWQNFGNDPKWLVPVSALLVAMATKARRLGDDSDASRFLLVAALACILYLPSTLTLAVSPLRHFGSDPAMFEPMLAGGPGQEDIYVRRDRGYSMKAEQFLDAPGKPWDRYADLMEMPEPTEIAGIPFPNCEFLAGSVNWLRTISTDLRNMGVEEGASLFTADILSAFWLYEPFRPLQNGAPWYYGELSGIGNADYVVVPKCGFAERVRQIIIFELSEAPFDYQVVGENERVALFRIVR